LQPLPPGVQHAASALQQLASVQHAAPAAQQLESTVQELESLQQPASALLLFAPESDLQQEALAFTCVDDCALC
jgi:hypothetical protein